MTNCLIHECVHGEWGLWAETISKPGHDLKRVVEIDKHIILQREKYLGLARGNTKKRGNKKFGESITPIRYNVIHNIV